MKKAFRRLYNWTRPILVRLGLESAFMRLWTTVLMNSMSKEFGNHIANLGQEDRPR
jgi:hypothetical protein